MITAQYHPGFAAPIGDHIMPMRKFGLVADALEAAGLACLVVPEPASLKDLLRVHTASYIDAVRTGEPRALAESQKFPWSPHLFPSVCLTSGACLAASRRALEDGCAAALASGFHQAHADHGEGFCTFNGLVVAVDALREERKIQRAAVLDLDLHYGNGTASLAAERPHLMVLSIYGNDYRDNTPYRDVTPIRHEDGENHLSVALQAQCDGAHLLRVLEEHVPRLLEPTPPDLLIYQAGADPLRSDPYSPLALTHRDLLERDRWVFRFGQRHNLPVMWVLAGGYCPQIEQVVQVHLNTFLAANETRTGAPKPKT